MCPTHSGHATVGRAEKAGRHRPPPSSIRETRDAAARREAAIMTGASLMDELCIDTIRTLSMDAVQQANSGHPGTPMAGAGGLHAVAALPALRSRGSDLAESRPFRAVHRPRLDAALLAAAPAGVKAVDADDERLGSPRSRSTTSSTSASSTASARAIPSIAGRPGVETTTGPLGQGCGNSVGMAIAERWLAQHFNRPGFELFDYDVYAHVRRRRHDGGRLERGGVARRPSRSSPTSAGSTTATSITIEGHTDLAFSEDVATRFLAYGWNVLQVGDANDTERDRRRRSRPSEAPTTAPTLIIVDSHIGYGAPHKQDTSAAHGEPLGEEEIRLDQAKLRLARGREVPGPGRRARAFPGRHRQARRGSCARRGRRRCASLPRHASGSRRRSSSGCSGASCPRAGTRDLPTFPADAKGIASRDSSAKVLNAIAQQRALADRRLGRSRALDQDAPDLRRRRRSSRPTTTAAATSISAFASTPWARSSTAWRCPSCAPIGSSFLIFTDYMSRPIRLERADGAAGHLSSSPTTRSASARTARRTSRSSSSSRCARSPAWSRSGRPTPTRWSRPGASIIGARAPARLPGADAARRCRRSTARATPRPQASRSGAYVWPTPRTASPTVILIGTGSEVALCVDAYETLKQEGIAARVVSMPSLGAVRAAGPGLSRQRAAARRHGARLGRGGLGDRLGSLRRASPAPGSACRPSAPRPRSRIC